jgi:hypothetical protein
VSLAASVGLMVAARNDVVDVGLGFRGLGLEGLVVCLGLPEGASDVHMGRNGSSV